MRSTRSCKAKGRRLQVHIQNRLREKYCNETTQLVLEDINSNMMGESGRDIKFSPLAERTIPFDIECKNVEKLDVLKALIQSKSNTKPKRIPIVIFKRNRSKIYVLIEQAHFTIPDSILSSEVKLTTNIWKHLSIFEDKPIFFTNHNVIIIEFEQFINFY